MDKELPEILREVNNLRVDIANTQTELQNLQYTLKEYLDAWQDMCSHPTEYLEQNDMGFKCVICNKEFHKEDD